MYLNKVLTLLVLLILILFNIFINISNFNNNSIFNNDTLKLNKDTLKLNNIKWVPVTPQVTLPVTPQSPALKITQAPALITPQVTVPVTTQSPALKITQAPALITTQVVTTTTTLSPLAVNCEKDGGYNNSFKGCDEANGYGRLNNLDNCGKSGDNIIGRKRDAQWWACGDKCDKVSFAKTNFSHKWTDVVCNCFCAKGVTIKNGGKTFVLTINKYPYTYGRLKEYINDKDEQFDFNSDNKTINIQITDIPENISVIIKRLDETSETSETIVNKINSNNKNDTYNKVSSITIKKI